MTTIAFDVDGTLIHQVGELEDTPRYDVINLLIWFLHNGNEVFIWSGGGVNYAENWCQKLGLSKEVIVIEKGSFVPDIAIDDKEVELGKTNIRV